MEITSPTEQLARRRAALEAEGFTVVELLEQGFVAVRMRFHLLWGVRMVALVRVQHVPDLDREACIQGQRGLQRLIHRHNPSKMPRGFGVFWSLMDVFLTDEAAPEALAYSRSKVGKGFGWSALTAIVTPDGVQPWARPMWGAAYNPTINQLLETAAHGERRPEASGWLGALVGILSIWPGWILITLSCCGLPLIPVVALVLTEDGPRPAVEGPPGGTPS